MKQSPNITVINYLCFLPFIALFGIVFILDDWETGTGIGKTIGFYVLMGLIPLSTALSYWNNRQSMKYHVVDLLIPLVVFFGLLFSYMNHLAVNNKMVTVVLLVVLYFCFRVFLVQRQTNLYVLLIAVMLTGFGEAIWGLLQLYGYTNSQHHLFKSTGSFFNPGPYAGYLAVIWPVALFYLLRDWWVWNVAYNRKLIYYRLRWGVALIALGCMLLVLPATMSRAAWIAAGASSAVVLGLYFLKIRHRSYFKESKRWSKAKWASLSLVAAMLLSILGTGLYHFKKDSADGRVLIWNVSMDMLERNWIGHGVGYFAGSYGKAQELYFSEGRGSEWEKSVAGEPEYAFNEFIQIAVELGVLSLILLLFAVLYAIRTGVRNRRFAPVGGLVALLIFAAFSYPFSLIPFLVLLIFLLAACVSAPYEFTYYNDVKYLYLFDFDVRQRWNAYSIIGLLVTSSILVGWSLATRYPVYMAHKKWGQTQVYYHAGGYDKAVEQYEGLFSYLMDQPNYLFEYGQMLFKIHRYDDSMQALLYGSEISADPMFHILMGKVLQAQKRFLNAETRYQHAAQCTPHRLYPYYLLAKLYDEMGEGEKAYKMALFVIDKPVKIDSPAVQEMRAEMKKHVQKGPPEKKEPRRVKVEIINE
ncbi:O-antigen ligase family protein [Sphingobacterium pedocola]|uniref:O-antigen ligase-related domain-containing protein n=1 Tax=Sphingobacterium pedocola TaxID=2082722 RepID=A0ABR9TAF7_9SPHI|nr:O-antigen ligase family protein [Sphingobacterium pedocola]MBE8722340.1 hypothetical protein [Sphingobacterium pedocola]